MDGAFQVSLTLTVPLSRTPVLLRKQYVTVLERGIKTQPLGFKACFLLSHPNILPTLAFSSFEFWHLGIAFL